MISPLLSNIFLHYVLDEWFAEEVEPRMKGKCFIIRWADDFIIGVQQETDADRVKAVLPKRFSRFGLELHPDKTSQIWFGRPPKARRRAEHSTFSDLRSTGEKRVIS